MALDKQNISISFSKGVDTKTDNKQVVPGKLLNLENAVLKKVGKFVKRFGYGVIADNAPITNGNALATFKNELIAYDGNSIYSYSSSDDKLYNKGFKVAVDISTQSVARNSFEQTNPDSAYHSNGISVYAWEDSSGGVRYSVFDVATNQTIVSNALVDATGSKPKVKTIEDYILIFFVDGTDLKYVSIDANNPIVLNAATTVASSIVGYYDVTYFNSLMYVAYATGTTASIFTLNSALVQSGVLSVSATPSCLGIFNDESDNLWCIYNQGNSVKYFIYDSTLTTQVLAPTTIETGSAPYVNVTGIVINTYCYVFYEVTGDIPSNQYVRYANISNSGSITFTGDFMRSVGIYSKPFLDSTSQCFITLTHQSDLQPTYFLVNLDQKVVSKLAPALGGGLSTTGLLAEVNVISTDNFFMAYEYKDFVQSVAGDVTTQTGINTVSFKFAQPILNAEIGNQLHSSGGIISAYDSQNINELGFNLYPEKIELSYRANGGVLSDGSYSYATTYEWTDSQGQIHRSAPYLKTLDIKNNTEYFTAGNGTSGGSFPQYSFYFNGQVGTGAYTGNIEESLQNIYIGKKLYIPQYGNTYVTGFADFRSSVIGTTNTIYIFVSNPITSPASSTVVTASGLPSYGINATSNVGSDEILAKEVSFISYVGTVTAGSNVIYIGNTKGLYVGMRLFSAKNTFPSFASSVISNRITAVHDDRIELDISASSSANNIILHFYAPFYGPTSTSATVFTYNSNIYGPMNYFIGQKVFAATNNINLTLTENLQTTITNIVNLGSGIYQITTASGIGTGTNNILYCVGLYPTYNLFNKQTINASANFENPLEITSINNIVGSPPVKQIGVDKEASGTGATFVTYDAFASPLLTVDTLRVSDKENLIINIYRTTNNGTVYYQVTSIGGIENNKTIDEVSFVDTVPDEVLVGNAQLYTTGGEVENIAPPAGNVIGTYKNRLLVVPNEDPISFWYSKQVRSNTPIEFNDSFIQRVPEKGGAITALQQMDDKLIIFKQDYVFVMVGDGPSVSGVNNDFTDPQVITADAGCLDKKSVVVLPTGLIYKSQKGFYLLDRALNVKYIGADVESSNAYTVTSAKMNETENQVRFTMSNGDTLVYDYYVEQWATFKGVNAIDAVNFQDKYTYLVPSGEIRKENTAFTDDGALIPMKIETAWLNLAGLQNYQRIYHIMLVGTYKSPHTLQIDLYRDFIETPYETVTIPVLTAPTKYQYRVFPSIQKCEAIKIKITELQSSPYGEGFDISAINIELGVKRGQNKLSPDESYG